MRTPESKIKQAILHPEEEMREQALHYFSDAHSQDDTVMPLVIQAVEKYGRDTAFSILRDADHLVQTDATIDWLMRELRRDYNTRKIAIAAIMDQMFPKFREWRKAALRDNWGKFQVEHARVADSFRPDLPGPKWSMN
jgi:hypothetical protein